METTCNVSHPHKYDHVGEGRAELLRPFSPAPYLWLRAQGSCPSSPALHWRARDHAHRSLGVRAPPRTWKGSGPAPGGHTLTGKFSRPQATSSSSVGASGSSSEAAIPPSYLVRSRSACCLDEVEPRRGCWESWSLGPTASWEMQFFPFLSQVACERVSSLDPQAFLNFLVGLAPCFEPNAQQTMQNLVRYGQSFGNTGSSD